MFGTNTDTSVTFSWADQVQEELDDKWPNDLFILTPFSETASVSSLVESCKAEPQLHLTRQLEPNPFTRNMSLQLQNWMVLCKNYDVLRKMPLENLIDVYITRC
jgi:hypothetical protein